jgi:hypothetical protein
MQANSIEIGGVGEPYPLGEYGPWYARVMIKVASISPAGRGMLPDDLLRVLGSRALLPVKKPEKPKENPRAVATGAGCCV